ncbi:hypothetical protein K491DRAFT_224478 [Lophiostoma macrostomum CBS 122681]|uniref:C2H2-type domain-containing protein n=1 Tax=Lophiostoma macrostomum CBS 122681 TaxID=1314788 RepID=A0A6A6TI12_9PLEO|nr:hypothetical protein K491DRAFT_224478 [Lophiostoma macrostomum CBS 122681]
MAPNDIYNMYGYQNVHQNTATYGNPAPPLSQAPQPPYYGGFAPNGALYQPMNPRYEQTHGPPPNTYNPYYESHITNNGFEGPTRSQPHEPASHQGKVEKASPASNKQQPILQAKCNDCGTGFYGDEKSARGNLSRHKGRHCSKNRREKPKFECNVCAKEFSRKDIMKKHRKDLHPTAP